MVSIFFGCTSKQEDTRGEGRNNKKQKTRFGRDDIFTCCSSRYIYRSTLVCEEQQGYYFPYLTVSTYKLLIFFSDIYFFSIPNMTTTEFSSLLSSSYIPRKLLSFNHCTWYLLHILWIGCFFQLPISSSFSFTTTTKTTTTSSILSSTNIGNAKQIQLVPPFLSCGTTTTTNTRRNHRLTVALSLSSNPFFATPNSPSSSIKSSTTTTSNNNKNKSQRQDNDDNNNNEEEKKKQQQKK